MEKDEHARPARFRPGRFEIDPVFPDTDERIREKVYEKLSFSHEFEVSNLKIHVTEGVVTLSGTVETKNEKKWAQDLIEVIPGVVDVNNYLGVKGQGPGLLKGLY